MNELEKYNKKIKTIMSILHDCKQNAKVHKKKYIKYKRIDDCIDMSTSILSATGISLILVGFTLPPFIIASGVLSGISFIISSGQSKYDMKSRYLSFHTTHQQYMSLIREIYAVLSKNNMSSDEYQSYIEEIYGKIDLISDTQIF